MKLNIVTNEKDTLEFYIEGERHTIANYLKEKIAQMEGIEFCAYKLDHPLENKAKFMIKGKNPKKALEEAIKLAKDELNEFKATTDKLK